MIPSELLCMQWVIAYAMSPILLYIQCSQCYCIYNELTVGNIEFCYCCNYTGNDAHYARSFLCPRFALDAY